MPKSEGAVADIVERIFQHVYIAGRFCRPYNRNAEDLSAKSFHLARACDLTDKFVDHFQNRSIAKKNLLKAFGQSRIIVLAYRYSEGKNGKPKPLDVLVDFLMGNVCHREITVSMLENFEADECPSILTEQSRAEARRCLSWLRVGVASVGVDPDFVTSGVWEKKSRLYKLFIKRQIKAPFC